MLKTERGVVREINQSISLKLPSSSSAKPHFVEIYNKIAQQETIEEFKP